MGIPSMKITKSRMNDRPQKRMNDPSYTVGGSYIGTTAMENSMEIPWKTKKKKKEREKEQSYS